MPFGALDGELADGAALDGTVDGLMLGVEPKVVVPPEALDEPIPGAVPTLLP